MKSPTSLFTLSSVVVVAAFRHSSPPPPRRPRSHCHSPPWSATTRTMTMTTRTRTWARRDIVGRPIKDNNQHGAADLALSSASDDASHPDHYQCGGIDEEEGDVRYVPMAVPSNIHPLGPPAYLSVLPVGGTTACRLLPTNPSPSSSPSIVDTDDDAESAACVITRLSMRPDVFLIRNGMSASDISILMDGAFRRGMKVAGTRSSPGGGGSSTRGDGCIGNDDGGVDEGRMRVGSYSTWIDPYDIGGCGDYDIGENKSALVSVARDAIARSRRRFSHEAMNDVMDHRYRHRSIDGPDDGNGGHDDDDSSYAEDMQVAIYVAGGGYDYHHDGYGRYLTVLSYLNGVGGTYFPFGNDDIGDDHSMPNGTVEFGGGGDDDDRRRGILIVGREGSNVYTTANPSSSYGGAVRRRDAPVRPKSIIDILPGDAIAFYNYDVDGSRDMRSLHCSLTVPEEKWIATCWYRSEGLTGPFGPMKKARLMDEWANRKEEDAQNVSVP